MAYGREPTGPIDLALAESSTSAKPRTRQAQAEELLVKRQRREIQVRKNLERAQQRYVKQVNKHKRQVRFEVGEKVWLSTKNFTLPKEITVKFSSKFARPFVIAKNPHEDVYTLELLPEWQVHPTFHVFFLKKYLEDELQPDRKQVLRPHPDLVKGQEEFEVETIQRAQRKSNRTEYLVTWRGYHVKEATWVLKADLENAKEVVEEFKRRQGQQKR